jgi:hypothetical protein
MPKKPYQKLYNTRNIDLLTYANLQGPSKKWREKRQKRAERGRAAPRELARRWELGGCGVRVEWVVAVVVVCQE